MFIGRRFAGWRISSLSRYRTQLGPADCEELLHRTIVAGLAEGVIEKRDLTEVLVATTVMEKAVTYPTDSKLYSLHASEVECISKGKAHKRYEFGVRVGVVASLKKPFILAAHALPGRSYDGHTLMRSLAQAALNTSVKIKTAVADKGYRGHGTWPGAPESSCWGSAVAPRPTAAGGVPGYAGVA